MHPDMQLFSAFPLSVCIHIGTHWHRIRRPLRCIRWDSSICNSHRCSCSDAHMDEVSGRTHSGLRIRKIFTFCKQSIEQINIFFLEKWILPSISLCTRFAFQTLFNDLKYPPWLHVFPEYPGKHLHLLGPTHSPCLHPCSHWAGKTFKMKKIPPEISVVENDGLQSKPQISIVQARFLNLECNFLHIFGG